MIRATLLSLAAAAAIAAPALAEVTVGAMVGHDEAEVRQTLTADGYEVRKVETEDGEIEAYALKDGKKLEVYVDAATGAVTRIKAE
jgi:hypothetical protein